MVASKWGPTEPVPDVYSTEVKENEAPLTHMSSATVEEPRKVRAHTFDLPRLYTRRSRSEHGALGNLGIFHLFTLFDYF